MPLKQHLENTLRINPEPTPLFKMLLSAMAITTPLIIGHFTHQMFVSMFGSLMGLVYYLNDHFDRPIPRLKHLIITFMLLMLSLIVGALSVGHNVFIMCVLFVLSFLVGKSKNHGIELERMMLFITLEFLTASSEAVIRLELNALLLHSSIAFINYLFFAYLIYFISGHKTHPMTSKRATVKNIIAANHPLKFPLVCASFSTLGFLVSHFFKFSHTNWIIATAIIVMLPDSYQSIYKGLQRILGTIAGVVLSSIILMYVHDPKLLILFVFTCAFLMPHGLAKNYWVGNIYIAALVLFFLEIAAPQSIDKDHLAYWRIVDIAIGSSIGFLAALWMKPELIKKSFKIIGGS